MLPANPVQDATTYSYDAENRLVTVSGAAAATFVYDGDGNRVKATFGSTTTVYVGNTYERDNGSTVRKYYYADGVRVAMRTGGQTYYLPSDHLAGTNVTADSSGVQISKLLYKPWGETRLSSGTTPTTWRFTGQREDATIGLYYFNARYLDPQLGRFTQPDTIVPEPGDPQALNRYSYVGNRPTILTDPSGLCALGPQSGGPDDRAENLAYQHGCWSVYYSLLDQGIPGLDWQWDYGLGSTIGAFAAANYATGPGSILGLAGALSYAGQDITGYILLTVGNSVALINGSPTYYMYVNATAAYDAETFYYTGGVGAGECEGICVLVRTWLRELSRPNGSGGRVDKLVPFTQASDLSVVHYTSLASDYINQTSYVYSGAQYIDILWGASGIAAFAHSAATFNWARSSLIQYAKLARSGISSWQTAGKMLDSLTTDYVKMSDLSSSLSRLPSQ